MGLSGTSCRLLLPLCPLFSCLVSSAFLFTLLFWTSVTLSGGSDSLRETFTLLFCEASFYTWLWGQGITHFDCLFFRDRCCCGVPSPHQRWPNMRFFVLVFAVASTSTSLTPEQWGDSVLLASGIGDCVWRGSCLDFGPAGRLCSSAGQ